jgi:hypothetical protein
VDSSDRYVLPAKVSLPHVQAWVAKARPMVVEYEGCKDFKCTACDRILTTIAGSGNGNLARLIVRLNSTEHMSPQRVLTTLAGNSSRGLVHLSLRTGTWFSFGLSGQATECLMGPALSSMCNHFLLWVTFPMMMLSQPVNQREGMCSHGR